MSKSLSSLKQNSSSRLPPTRHPRYYFEDELSVFLVEDKLFKVHRHFLVQESDVFRGMFSCPPGSEGPEGRTDDNPIPLPGVLCREFETLLDSLYEGINHPLVPADNASLQHWIDLLSISTRFNFERVRQYAISRIDAGQGVPDPVERIVLAEKHNIPQWLLSAYIALCARTRPLDVREAKRVGLRVTTLIAQAREAVRGLSSYSPNSQAQSSTSSNAQPTHPRDHSLVEQTVRDIFFSTASKVTFPPLPNARKPKISLGDGIFSGLMVLVVAWVVVVLSVKFEPSVCEVVSGLVIVLLAPLIALVTINRPELSFYESIAVFVILASFFVFVCFQ